MKTILVTVACFAELVNWNLVNLIFHKNQKKR